MKVISKISHSVSCFYGSLKYLFMCSYISLFSSSCFKISVVANEYFWTSVIRKIYLPFKLKFLLSRKYYLKKNGIYNLSILQKLKLCWCNYVSIFNNVFLITCIFFFRNILLNYGFYNPKIGYTQGMSDLLAPILAAVQDESEAFWCFVGLMQRTIFVTCPKDFDMDVNLVSFTKYIIFFVSPF